MKRCISVIMIVFATCFWAMGCCPKNPTLNSAISAHGNTDWHIDTANEFLFGTDMAGADTAANHCPDTWTRRHMHVDLTNTNHYYYDKDVTSGGEDTHATEGIDRAMLFFYAGHGCPTYWNTLGNDASQGNMRLGDCQNDNKGILRYYWQCSCEVFAHGPRTCPGAGFDYACPGDFDGSADSYNMRNVYERWGSVLSPQLRMACGASTPAYCHESQANRIWDRYNNMGFDVADAFIDGLNVWGVVPLCITMGGADVNTTPLVTDSAFTNLPNTAGTSHYHIQYLSSFAGTPRSPSKVATQIPQTLPVYHLQPLPVPKMFQRMKFSESGNIIVTKDDTLKEPIEVRINRLSGAIYLRREGVVIQDKILDESMFLSQAKSIIMQYELMETQMNKPTAHKMMIDTVPVKGAGKPAATVLKSVTVEFRRHVEYQGAKIDVLGDGGAITVRMNGDGSMQSVSKVWRPIAATKSLVPVKRFEEALAEAKAQLEKEEKYRLDSWNWGYKELDGNISQNRLGIVYQFAFMPKENKEMIDFPPRMIEIHGQKE